MSAVLTGTGAIVLDPKSPEKQADPREFLRTAKTRKFMGTQDDLAVVAVGNALRQARLDTKNWDGERVGVFAAIGFIPFEERDIGPVLEGSLTKTEGDDAFDLRKFCEDGYLRAHPLLTFRCLPNMPAFHVSLNFAAKGPYFVTYPGAGQAYLALREALFALEEDAIDVAIVFATSHQRNFLVEHHYERIDAPVDRDSLRDAAGALILERARDARAIATLSKVDVAYAPFDPLERDYSKPTAIEFGAATPLLEIANRLENKPFRDAPSLLHESAIARDGISGRSEWSAP